MKVLVTGGAGFIGSHIVDEYIKQGFEVAIVDNMSTGKMDNVNPSASLYRVDIRDKIAMHLIFDEFRPNIVNHHAAQKSIGVSIDNPIYDMEVNVNGTLNLLECSVEYGVSRFIAASSGGALSGDSYNCPTAENEIVNISSPYAASKYSMEQYLRYYHGKNGMDCFCLRYANVYGPRQDFKCEGGVVSILLHNAINYIQSTIYVDNGMLYGAVRDYIYIDDVVEANMCTASGTPGVYNIGTGKSTTTAALYAIVCDITGSNQFAKTENTKKMGVSRSVLNCDNAREGLGWTFKTYLRDGVAKMHEYMVKEEA